MGTKPRTLTATDILLRHVAYKQLITAPLRITMARYGLLLIYMGPYMTDTQYIVCLLSALDFLGSSRGLNVTDMGTEHEHSLHNKHNHTQIKVMDVFSEARRRPTAICTLHNLYLATIYRELPAWQACYALMDFTGYCTTVDQYSLLLVIYGLLSPNSVING